MAKKKSWFTRIKDLFFPGTDEQETKLKKQKKKRWLFRWMRTTKRPPSLAAPSLSRERTEDNGREQQVHQALPAASEEAGARSSTTTTPFGSVSFRTSAASASQFEEKNSEFLTGKIHLTHSQLVRHVEALAAVKIQTAFRGYLARKALRALKGLVRLQAIIRGRSVRRQAVATLKCLQSIVNIQSQVCATRYQIAKEERQNEEDSREGQNLKNEKLKFELSSQRRWDDSLLTKDEENVILLGKTEAMLRRNRAKAYSFNHRHSAELDDGRTSGRLRYWLEEHVAEELPQKEEIKRVDTIGGKQLRLRNTQPTQQTTELMLYSLASAPRRSFHCRKHRPRTGSEGRLDCAPAYMAATESAKARLRSTSSPRLRPVQLDCYSDGDSPYKMKLSPMSSLNSDRTCTGGNAGGNLRVKRSQGSGSETKSWLMNWG